MKNVFIIFAEGFDKGWLGAYSRITDITNVFIEMGYGVTLLKSEIWYQSKNQSLQEKSYKGRIVNTPFVGGYFKLLDRNFIFRKINRFLWKINGKDFYNERLATGWYKDFKQWWSITKENETPDYLWSICTSNLNNLLVGDYLSKKYSCPHIIEFQDPPSDFPHTLIKIFERILQDCFAIVTVTESYKNYLIEKYSLDNNKLWLMYLSFEIGNNTLVKRKEDDKIVFLHGGSLYDGKGQRNALDLINGFIQASNQNPKIKEKVLITFLGPGKYFKKTNKYIIKNKLTANIIIKEDVHPREFTRQLYLADILVVIKYPTQEYDAQIPGKLFQYLAIKKPILGLMRKESEASNILSKTGLGWIIEPGNIDEISRFIIQTVTDDNFIKDNFIAIDSYINRFTFVELNNQIRNLFRTLK